MYLVLCWVVYFAIYRYMKCASSQMVRKLWAMLVRLLVFSIVFFFSSRRRHTRCSRDWSSDVCSSDLILLRHPALQTPVFYVRDANGTKCLSERFPQFRGWGEAPLRSLSTEAIISSNAGDRKSVV